MPKKGSGVAKEKKKSDKPWWAYRHTNGEVKVKVYFSHLDIKDAKESPFVAEVAGPECFDNWDEAIKHFNTVLGKKE